MDTNGSIRSSPQTTHGRGRSRPRDRPFISRRALAACCRCRSAGAPAQAGWAGAPHQLQDHDVRARLASESAGRRRAMRRPKRFRASTHPVDASCSGSPAEYRQTSGRSAECDIRQRIARYLANLRGLPNVPNIIPPYWPTRIAHNFFLGEGSCPREKCSGEVARVYPFDIRHIRQLDLSI